MEWDNGGYVLQWRGIVSCYLIDKTDIPWTGKRAFRIETWRVFRVSAYLHIRPYYFLQFYRLILYTGFFFYRSPPGTSRFPAIILKPVGAVVLAILRRYARASRSTVRVRGGCRQSCTRWNGSARAAATSTQWSDDGPSLHFLSGRLPSTSFIPLFVFRSAVARHIAITVIFLQSDCRRTTRFSNVSRAQRLTQLYNIFKNVLTKYPLTISVALTLDSTNHHSV